MKTSFWRLPAVSPGPLLAAFNHFHTADYRSNTPLRLAKHVSLATWAAFRVGPRGYGIPRTAVGGCWNWTETVANRQNSLTDVDSSLKSCGRREFHGDKHVPQPPAEFLASCGIALSVNKLYQHLEAVYTHQVISFARDGFSWRISSETIYRLFPSILNLPLPVWPWGDTHT